MLWNNVSTEKLDHPERWAWVTCRVQHHAILS